MSELKLYWYPNCSTCKAALRFLTERGLAYEAIDISKSPPGRDELRRMAELRGGVRALFNTSGRSYRDGRFAEKLQGMTLDEAVDALAEDGMLVRRPFLLSAGLGLVGFKIEEWNALAAE